MSALDWVWEHCKYHHFAKERGYISRVDYANRPKIVAYKGRFGVGFKLITPRYDTTRYVNVCYYIF